MQKITSRWAYLVSSCSMRRETWNSLASIVRSGPEPRRAVVGAANLQDITRIDTQDARGKGASQMIPVISPHPVSATSPLRSQEDSASCKMAYDTALEGAGEVCSAVLAAGGAAVAAWHVSVLPQRPSGAATVEYLFVCDSNPLAVRLLIRGPMWHHVGARSVRMGTESWPLV